MISNLPEPLPAKPDASSSRPWRVYVLIMAAMLGYGTLRFFLTGSAQKTPNKGDPQSTQPSQVLNLDQIRLKADKGEKEAQYQLGIRYRDAWDVNRDDAESARWFRKAADQGHAKAQFEIAERLRYGRGVKESPSQARSFYQLAADQGIPAAYYELGSMEQHKVDPMPLFLKSSQMGYSRASTAISDRYKHDGRGIKAEEISEAGFIAPEADRERFRSRKLSDFPYIVPDSERKPFRSEDLLKDETLSTKWRATATLQQEVELKLVLEEFLGLAEAGNPSAQLVLSNLYDSGETPAIPQNGQEALKWLKKAEAAIEPYGEADHFKWIIRSYTLGKSIPRDKVEAKKWALKGLIALHSRGEKGDPASQYMLGELYRTERIEKEGSFIAPENERVPPENSPELGNYWQSETTDGWGIRLEKNNAKAEMWFKKAADQGQSRAAVELLEMLKRGEIPPQSNEQVALWENLRIEGFSAYEQYQHAKKLMESGKDQDKEAGKWIKKSAEREFPPAALMAGLILKNVGEGEVALKWLKMASDNDLKDANAVIALMYARGDTIPKDEKEAIRYYRKYGNLDRSDDTEAVTCLRISRHFYDGDTVSDALILSEGWRHPVDKLAALQWYRKAAELGDELAQLSLGMCYYNCKFLDPSEYPVGETESTVTELNRLLEDEDKLLAAFIAAVKTLDRKNISSAELDWNRARAKSRAYQKQNPYYLKDDDVFLNPQEGKRFLTMSAEQGNSRAQHILGSIYEFGFRTSKDQVEALAWFNIAAISPPSPITRFLREQLEEKLGTQFTLIAQQRSKEILARIEAKKRAGTSDSKTSNPLSTEIRPKGSGSGAIISNLGHILTAAHVVKGATSVVVFTSQGKQTAQILRIDEPNDLAILKIPDGSYPFLPVAPSSKMRLGQSVATIGFPNIGLQGFSPKVTKGEISSINGFTDDPREWQISVPVQPGNSGGPLLDDQGNIVGVVLSRLAPKEGKTGGIPQNVNYAIKSAYALPLLEPYMGNNARPLNTSKLKFEDMVDKAQEAVVLILIY